MLLLAPFFIFIHNGVIADHTEIFERDGQPDSTAVSEYRWYLFDRHFRFGAATLVAGWAFITAVFLPVILSSTMSIAEINSSREASAALFVLAFAAIRLG